MPRSARAGDGLRRLENALRTAGVARRRAAAEPRQIGRGPDRAEAAPGPGARRPRPGASVRQDPERKPRHRLRHLPRPGVPRGGRPGAVDRHGRQRAGPGADAGPGAPIHPPNAPTLVNAGLGSFYLFWDGRVSGNRFGFQTPAGTALPSGLPSLLAAQAMFPVMNREEMRGARGDSDRFGNPNELADFGDSDFVSVWQAVMRRLLAIPEYASKFNAAFPQTSAGELAFQHAATAIAAFETQALTKTNSPFDRYLLHDDAALTSEQKRGALLFFGDKARCASCHGGPLLGGGDFANAGVPQLGPGTGSGAPLDFGRGELFHQEFYRFAFRATALRNVELTGPYMHDGAFPTLEAVLHHYNDVPRALREYDASQLPPALQQMYHSEDATIAAVLTNLDGRLTQPLNLSGVEISELVAFLKSLTDPAARDLTSLIPARVPSGLPVQE